MKLKLGYLYFILFSISSMVISNQIALMQLFAYQQWYHFASMIISMALIGFGVSGLIIPFIKKRFSEDLSSILHWLLVFVSLSFPLSLIIDQKILSSFDSFLIFFDIKEALKFFLVIINFTFVFTLLALIIGLFFSLYPQSIGKLYFWNLVGSAFGGLLVVILLWLFLPQQILVLNGVVLLLIVSFEIIKSRRKNFIVQFLFVVALIINFSLLVFPSEFKPSQFKSISRFKNLPDFKFEFQKSSPYGFIEIVSSKHFRFSPGLSLNFTGEIPRVNYILLNGEVVGYDLIKPKEIDQSFLKNSTLFLPYYLKEFNEALILNASGGIEIFRSLNGRVKNILVTELNPLLLSFVKKKIDELNLFNVELKKVDQRIFLETTEKKFDLIFYPVIEPVGLTSGLYAIQEKFLLTNHAFQKIYERLIDNGYFVISCYIDNPARSFLKILNLLLTIKGEMGENLSFRQLVAVNNWNVITFVLKKGEFSKEEIASIKSFCDLNQFDFLLRADSEISTLNYNSVFDQQTINLIYSITNRDISKIKTYFFDISAPNDNRPYFSNYIKLENFNFYLEQISLRSLTYSEIGYFIIWVSFSAVVLIASSLLFFGSLMAKIQKRLKFVVLVYFSFIGIAYMLIELSLIQKFVLIFSADVYAITFVISILLISSGIGSLLTSKFRTLKLQHTLIFILIFVYGVALIIFFKSSTDTLISQSNFLKFILSVLIIFPLGFLMGMPFPIGIKLISSIDSKAIPFAWAVNGSFSVVGSLGSILLLVNFGFNETFLFALIIYLILCFGFMLVNSKKHLLKN